MWTREWTQKVPSESHLVPVAQLVVGQVQSHHMGAEGCDVGTVPGFADPTLVQNQRAGQEETIWTSVYLVHKAVPSRTAGGRRHLTFHRGSRRAGQDHHALAIGEVVRVVLLAEDMDEGAALLFIRRRVHVSEQEDKQLSQVRRSEPSLHKSVQGPV